MLLNAGAALYIGGKASSLTEGIERAGELLDTGAALKKLEEFVGLTNRLAVPA